MKYLVILILFGVIAVVNGNQQINISPTVSEINNEAFYVLRKKCNVCHLSQNPNKVFTLENMNGFSMKIYRQVFIWKRMPKGNEIKLSLEEKEILKNWINSLKK